MNIKWKRSLIMLLRGWGLSIAVAVLIATSFKSAVADWNTVPTGSMKPSILEGDRIFINKVAYDLKFPYTTWRLASWGDPARGDIVVFFSPEDGKRLIKRVIGLPGDVIMMRDNRLLINGEAVDYNDLPREVIDQIPADEQSRHIFYSETAGEKEHPVMLTPGLPSLRSFLPVTIPEGQYFMMGDNRDNSADSRFFGLVDRRLIVGKALAVVMSLKPEQHHLPRWDRFFRELP